MKLNIKNTQIAEALQLGKLKDKLAKKKADQESEKKPAKTKSASAKITKKTKAEEPEKEELEEAPRRKARSKSVFAEPSEIQKEEAIETTEEAIEEIAPPEVKEEPIKVTEEVDQVEKVIETPPPPPQPKAEPERLGPTGRHIKDLLPKAKPKPPANKTAESKPGTEKDKPKAKSDKPQATSDSSIAKKGGKAKFKEFRDLKPTRKQPGARAFDSRDRQGLRGSDDDHRWRKRRQSKHRLQPQEDTTQRPTELSIRLPIPLKDLAAEMKLKASQLISKLFLQGLAVTINDILDDETTVQLLGEEFGCTITIDTTEEERIRITDKNIKEEINESSEDLLKPRAPVVTFMGHVDHGKTSLIDYIRKSNITSGEAGEITQHIGAFLCETAVGPISILDTPGHEAFSAMRSRGADVTDIVVLVIAGNEGMRAQTEEALLQAKEANKTIVVAINKSDTPNFDPENVYRQLADQDLLPESWGGQTITINCSAKTGDGISELLEMLALQAEILELRANPDFRARGTVIESEMHKGMGSVATILVQNGTLRIGDSLVFEQYWGKIKTMRDEFGNQLQEAGPSTPVEITGLSGLPEAGQEFIVVKDEKEARSISSARLQDFRQIYLQQKKTAAMESAIQKTAEIKKKVLHVVLRADVQGSLEAVKTALEKIKSDKAEVNIVNTGVGEVSESDVELAAASNAIIIGFHTRIESHAEPLVKRLGVTVKTHDIIYHAVDDVKALMTELLDKIAEENEKGKAEVRTVFKSSQLGLIAGCIVSEGTIHRNNHVRVIREGEMVWKGSIASLKRVKEDVREVQKGIECGILLQGFKDIQEGDIIEAYEINYISQEL